MNKSISFLKSKMSIFSFVLFFSFFIVSCEKEELPPTNMELEQIQGEYDKQHVKEGPYYIDASLPDDLIPIEDPT